MENAKSIKRNKISIIFYQPHPEYGSTEEQFSLIMQGLNKTGKYEISVFCPSDKKVDKLAIANSGGTVIRFPKFTNGLNEILYLYKRFKNIKPNIIHINSLAFNAMIAGNLAGIRRKIISYHSPVLDIKFNIKGRISRRLGFRGDWDVITQTDSLKEFMVKYRNVKQDKIKIINYGLDRNKFVVTADKEKMRKSLGIPEDDFVIINVGRLCEEKAQHILLQSMRFLSSDILRKTIVVIAGEGEERSFLEKIIKELDLFKKVFLLGHRKDIPNLLAMSDVFVLSSVTEGEAVCLIEAMAMGVPIIAPNIDGVKDTVADHEMGILIPPRDPKKLAETIELLSKDEAKRKVMGDAGKRRFNKYFTKDKMIQEFRQFYLKSI